jgi:hypothetical protein
MNPLPPAMTTIGIRRWYSWIRIFGSGDERAVERKAAITAWDWPLLSHAVVGVSTTFFTAGLRVSVSALIAPLTDRAVSSNGTEMPRRR